MKASSLNMPLFIPMNIKTSLMTLLCFILRHTVWSTHVLLALDENGQKFLDALHDEDLQSLAWTKHGFRTGNYSTASTGGVYCGQGRCT